MSLTMNELTVLRQIVENHFNDLPDMHELLKMPARIGRLSVDVWSDCICDNHREIPGALSGHMLAGVMGSLAKKDMIMVREYDKGRNTVTVTDAGFEAWRTYVKVLRSAQAVCAGGLPPK